MATLADDDALVVLKTETASSVVIYVMGRIIASYDKYLSSENFFLLEFNSSVVIYVMGRIIASYDKSLSSKTFSC